MRKRLTTHQWFVGQARCVATILLACGLLTTTAMGNAFVDRWYQFGEDEGALFPGDVGVGQPFGVESSDTPGTFLTYDSAFSDDSGFSDAQDLVVHWDTDTPDPSTRPTYVDVSGRPSAGSSTLGARFDGTAGYLQGVRLNSPNEIWDNEALLPDFPNNYDGIFSRGISVWVKPSSAGQDTLQDIVLDTREHGIHITAENTWGLAFDKGRHDSGVAVVFDQWAHVMTASRSGAQGETMWVDGIAVQARNTFYDNATGTNDVLSIGAGVDSGSGDVGNFYNGDMDELRLFLWGDNSDSEFSGGQDWGSFSLAEDNEWIANEIAELAVIAGVGSFDDADVNFDGNIDGADATAFVAGWRTGKVINGLNVGDWDTRQNGDLNWDGVVNLTDAFMLHEALVAAGSPVNLFDALSGAEVPEPGTMALLGLGGLTMLRRRRGEKVKSVKAMKSVKSSLLLTVAMIVCTMTFSASAAEMQWGFDFTSGDVGTVDGGTIVNDGTDATGQLDGVLFRGTPFYTADIPGVTQLQNTTGIGSVNVVDASLSNVGTVADIVSDASLIAAGGITMEIWAKEFTSNTARSTALVIGDAFTIELRGDQVKSIVNSSSNPNPIVDIDQPGRVALGWTHYAVAFEVNDVNGDGSLFDNTHTLYINGQQVAQSTGLTYIPVFDGVAARRGVAGSGSNFDFDFEGLLFEPRISLGVLDSNDFTTTGVVIPINLTLEVDRETGSMTVINETGSDIPMLGYSVLSEAGGLDQANWTTIKGNQDAAAGGPFDTDDNWTILTGVGVATDLSEAEFDGGDGGVVTPALTLDFGQAWVQSPFEDVQFEYLAPDGSTKLGLVRYVGNGGASLQFGDFDGNGSIDVNDWLAFKAAYGSDVDGLTTVEAYNSGDLNDDGVSDLNDFLAFQGWFDAANGAGALSIAIADVPEPATMALLGLGGLGLLRRRRNGKNVQTTERKISVKSSKLFAVMTVCVLAVTSQSQAALDGFNVGSDTFANKSTGIEMNNGGGFVSPWSGGGGILQDDLSLNGSNLTWTQTTNNGWIQQDGGGTPWEDGIGGSWTVEMKVQINIPSATPTGENEMVMWFDDGTSNMILQIADNQMALHNTPGTPLDTNANNDGFHMFRVAYDKTDDAYHIWRDDVPVTGPAGVGRRGGTGNTRMILGDCCSTGGQDGAFLTNLVEFEYARFDMTGAYSPVGENNLTLEINSATGETMIMNDGAPTDFDVSAYSITSVAGLLDTGNWDSLEDQGIGDDGTPNNGIGFEELGTPGINEVAEADLVGSTLVSDGTNLSLGNIANITGGTEGTPQGDGDLVFQFTDASGSLVTGLISYIYEESSLILGDVNGDGLVNGFDVDPFVDVLLNGPYQAEADVNEDGAVNGFDVDPFVALVLGGGSAPEGTEIPEPATLVLLGLGGFAAMRRRK